jgi:hypothetical protein
MYFIVEYDYVRPHMISSFSRSTNATRKCFEIRFSKEYILSDAMDNAKGLFFHVFSVMLI